MPDWLRAAPLELAILALFVIVFCRAQGTYWLARVARNSFSRTRFGRHLDGDRLTRATELLRARGLVLIPLSFLTIGFQTAVNASAGLIEVPWPRYTLYMLPGCLAWALIYATVGMAAFEAWLLLAAGSPWAPWVVGLVALVVVASVVIRRRLSRSIRQADHGD